MSFAQLMAMFSTFWTFGYGSGAEVWSIKQELPSMERCLEAASSLEDNLPDNVTVRCEVIDEQEQSEVGSTVLEPSKVHSRGVVQRPVN